MNIIQFALIGLGAMVSMGAAAEQRSPEAVVAQEQAWADALLKADMATVADLMHPHFRLVRAYGDAPPISREMYLGAQGMTVHSVEIERADVTFMGDVAIVDMVMNFDWESAEHGQLPPRFRLTDTWLVDDGQWKVIARVSQIAKEPKASE
jgi:ketosteroid isomerase-like protein